MSLENRENEGAIRVECRFTLKRQTGLPVEDVAIVAHRLVDGGRTFRMSGELHLKDSQLDSDLKPLRAVFRGDDPSLDLAWLVRPLGKHVCIEVGIHVRTSYRSKTEGYPSEWLV